MTLLYMLYSLKRLSIEQHSNHDCKQFKYRMNNIAIVMGITNNSVLWFDWLIIKV